jgi:hypothetical protein
MAFGSVWKTGVAAISIAFAAQPALAATHILNLTGTVSSGSTFSASGFGFQFDFFRIDLQGMTPLTLAAGDDVQASITFDQSITVPTALAGNFVRLYLFPSNPVSTTTGTSGTTDLFDMGSPVLGGASGSGSGSGFVFNVLFNPTGPTFAFDTMQSNFTITDLSDPTLDVDLASFDYVLRTPLPAIPEPASWAMMIAGFAAVGAGLRRRPKITVTYA